MITLQNDFLKLSIKKYGAELCSVFHRLNNLEYLWQAGKEWTKHSPLLFPIVGNLKNECYKFNNKEYKLSRHGFARDKYFTVEEQNETSAVLVLKSDEETLKIFPFQFEVRIHYFLQQASLHIGYHVKNTGTDVMYFSIGGHPAFNVPLYITENYNDYYLQFNSVEKIYRHRLLHGLIDDKTEEIKLIDGKTLPLTYKLFEQDALVIKERRSTSISLKSNTNTNGLHFNFNNCPYLGLWAAPNSNFICIEPWHGIADSIHATGELADKEGVIMLQEMELFDYVFSIDFF